MCSVGACECHTHTATSTIIISVRQRCVTLIFSAWYLPLFVRLFPFECVRSLFHWSRVIHTRRSTRYTRRLHNVCTYLYGMIRYSRPHSSSRFLIGNRNVERANGTNGDDVRRSILFALDSPHASKPSTNCDAVGSNGVVRDINLFALVWFSLFIFDLFNVIMISNLFVQTKLVHVRRVRTICVHWQPCKFHSQWQRWRTCIGLHSIWPTHSYRLCD